VGSFLDAIKDGSEAALRHILIAHSPGVFTFNMLKPAFCSMMLEEVEHFEKWAQDAKVKVMRPNTMNNYGAVLDDIGMENMLNELMTHYLNPMAAVLFPNVGGSSLDSHHGFVVEYAMDRDLDLGGCHNPCTLRIACPTGSLLPPLLLLHLSPILMGVSLI
jgi:hypothetical protein